MSKIATNKFVDEHKYICNNLDMNIVEKVVKRAGSQTKLAKSLTEITGHPYKQGHVSYWLGAGHFPSDIADVVANQIMGGDITASEACPKIKQPIAA